MSRLEQLKIQAKASLEAAITKAKEEAEERRYNAIISGGVDRVMAISAVKEATSEELKAVEMACSMIVKDLPLTNKATREIRKWNPSRVYGYGNQIGALVGILSGIQYSAAEHRLQMLATTGLNEQIIEDTLNAFGSPSYFSAKYETIVPEKTYCINSIKNSLEVLEIKLNINLDKDAITEELLSKQFESARLRAETERNNYLVTKQTKTITVEG